MKQTKSIANKRDIKTKMIVLNWYFERGKQLGRKEIHFINNDAATVDIFSNYFQKKFGRRDGYQKVNTVDSMSATATSDVRYRNEYAVKKPTSYPRRQQQPGRKLQEERQQQEHSNLSADETQTMQVEGGITIELVIGDLAKQKVIIIFTTVFVGISHYLIKICCE